MKLPLRDLNPDSCSPHPTSIYTCGVTTAPSVHGGYLEILVDLYKTLGFSISYLMCLFTPYVHC